MMQDYWLKQTEGQPLYPELLWSRPENKRQAGKLLIVSGNSFGFSAVGEAYAGAVQAGIGTARVLLPEAIRKVVGQVLEHAEFATSNPSGGFSKQALGELLEQSAWADGVLLAGDFGKNSETAVLLEQFIQKYGGQLTVTKDTVDYFLDNPTVLFDRPDTCLVVSMGQLQKLAQALHWTTAITTSMDILRLVEALHQLTETYGTTIVVKQYEKVFVASKGRVSTTELKSDATVWRVKTASKTAVWWLQNPTKTYETITTSLYFD